MHTLTSDERDFIERGGAIWCVSEVSPAVWKIVKLSWETEDVMDMTTSSEESAVQWLYVLADLALPGERMTIHHKVKRSFGDSRFLGTAAGAKTGLRDPSS